MCHHHQQKSHQEESDGDDDGDNNTSTGSSYPKPSSTISVPDSHCHPTDTSSTVHLIPGMWASRLTAMATNGGNQALVAELTERFPEKVVPGFGWHPWFSSMLWDDEDEELKLLWEEGERSHGERGGMGNGEWELEFKMRHYAKVLKRPSGGGGQSSALPREFVQHLTMPRKLRGDALIELRNNLSRFKSAGRGVVLGEVGLDRGFRLPWPKGYREGVASTRSPKDSDINQGQRGSEVVEKEEEEGEGEGEKEKSLSPYRVSMDHQLLVFTAQLGVSGELGIPASVHSVQAHGTMFDTLRGLWRGWEVHVESSRERKNREMRGKKLRSEEKEWVDRFLLEDGAGLEELDSDNDSERVLLQKLKSESQIHSNHHPHHQSQKSQVTRSTSPPPPFPPRICLHSFSAPPQTLLQYNTPPSPTTAYPTDMYYSFSTTINSRNLTRFVDVLKLVPKERVLVESDLHIAGEEMDAVLQEAAEIVGKVKGWDAQEVGRVLQENWLAWVYGSADNVEIVRTTQ